MSGTVHYKGKLKEIKEKQTRTLEEISGDIIDERGLEVPHGYETNLEYITQELYENYVLLNKRLYEIVEKENFYGEILEAQRNEDETIDFHVMYHNSGCSLEEAIEHALKNNKIE